MVLKRQIMSNIIIKIFFTLWTSVSFWGNPEEPMELLISNKLISELTYFFLCSLISSLCHTFAELDPIGALIWTEYHYESDLHSWLAASAWALPKCWKWPWAQRRKPVHSLTSAWRDKSNREGPQTCYPCWLAVCAFRNCHITWTWETLTMSQELFFKRSLSCSRAGEILRLKRVLHRSLRPTH